MSDTEKPLLPEKVQASFLDDVRSRTERAAEAYAACPWHSLINLIPYVGGAVDSPMASIGGWISQSVGMSAFASPAVV